MRPPPSPQEPRSHHLPDPHQGARPGLPRRAARGAARRGGGVGRAVRPFLGVLRGRPRRPTPTTAKRSITVSRPAGATVTGSGINCGSTCTNSVTVGGFCDGADCSYDPATTWSLTATAPPAGYTATWTGCDSATQGT